MLGSLSTTIHHETGAFRERGGHSSHAISPPKISSSQSKKIGCSLFVQSENTSTQCCYYRFKRLTQCGYNHCKRCKSILVLITKILFTCFSYFFRKYHKMSNLVAVHFLEFEITCTFTLSCYVRGKNLPNQDVFNEQTLNTKHFYISTLNN